MKFAKSPFRQTAIRARVRRRTAIRDRRLDLERLEARQLLHGVTAISPFNGQANVVASTNVAVTFDFDADPATVNTSTFQLRDPQGSLVPSVVSYDQVLRVATLDPVAALPDVSDFYTAQVLGGPSGVREAITNAALEEDVQWSFITQTPTFSVTLAIGNLNRPTAVDFSADGRVFVAEKTGIVRVFDGLDDPDGADVLIDLSTDVHNHADRGLLGMALHPDFPETPYLYVLYTYDAAVGASAPYWGTPGIKSDPGPFTTGAGSSVSGKISRLEVAPDNALVERLDLYHDWGQQYSSHSVGSLAFGADGALYATAGDGASFNVADYGQNDGLLDPGTELNDPPNQGGALRSQDLRSRVLGDPVPDDPVSPHGAVIRIDPLSLTGAPLPDNPLFGDADANAERIIAYGMRNPFRMTVKPGTNEVWIGDVGWSKWEEINVIRDPTDALIENFGWPAYEGPNPHPGYDGLDLPLLEDLYADPDPNAHIEPFFAYDHAAEVVPNSGGPTGSSAISGLAFSEGGNLPPAYDGALFFTDYARDRMWVMFQGLDGDPDPNSVAVVAPFVEGPTQLTVGPDGDLFYVEVAGESIYRVRFEGVDKPPVAVAQATPTSGASPLVVQFDATSSYDPNPGDVLSYSWDLDGDGQFGDSTSSTPEFTFVDPGIFEIGLQVTDSTGLSAADTVEIVVDNSAPQAVIDAPTGTASWQVGDEISFSGYATDLDEGTLPPSALQWDLILHHCPSGCHEHFLSSFAGVSGGTFTAPDHEYPSYLELRLTATDSTGLQSVVSVDLYPQTVDLTLATIPAGLQVNINATSQTSPFDYTVIAGSENLINAPSPQTLGGIEYGFVDWSDGGAKIHSINAGSQSQTLTARFAPTVELGAVNSGIAVEDAATGAGYVMYSSESVHTRFSLQPPHPENSDQLIVVSLNQGTWYYHNDNGKYAFVPRSTDVLLAAVDFDDDAITDLQGVDAAENGIHKGYASGDLTFFANRFGGVIDPGEFTVLGTFFVPNTVVADPAVRTGVASGIDESWTTVTLDRSYGSMVVVATPNYDVASPPVVTRIRNAAGDSFELRVQRADGLTGAIAPVDVHYLVVEEGVYTAAEHGITMEAAKHVSTRTDRSKSWVGQSRVYANSYANPVVLGQVMTSNDAGFSAFWSRGDTFKDPPSSTSLWVGKHVAGDPNVVRADETVGYLVVEAGGGVVDGWKYTAAVGADAVSGITGPAPYTYAINGPALPVSAVVSQTAMDGNDGGWAVLYGPNPVTQNNLQLAIDEDQLADAERAHTNEQVAYVVFAPATPTVSVVANDAAAAEEGPDPGQFTISRDMTAGDLTVYYTLAGAASANDYAETLSGALTIPDGSSTATLTVTPIDDGEVEGDELLTLTLTPDATYTVDGAGVDTITIADNDAAASGPSVRTGVATGIDGTWTTVTLDRSFASMVVVATPNYDAASPPLVTRIQNAAGNSFDVRVQRADGLSGAVGPVDVHYLVVEEGVYTAAEHGVTMEAVKYVSTRTDRVQSWVGQSRVYANNYIDPVVLGQVMTANDAGFSTFWSRGGTFKDPPSPTSLWVGKHVAGDPNVVRADETVGYLVLEAGAGVVDGWEYSAAVGADAVSGITGSAPYTYAINGPTSPVAAVVSQTAMDGTDGGWALLYGADPITETNLQLAIDEDQLADAERGHTSEQVAYVIFAPATPKVSVAANDANAAEEGLDPGQFTISRDGAAGDLLVAYTLTGSASANDYTETLSGALTIPDGSSTATLTVTPVDDGDVEGDELLTLTLTPDATYTVDGAGFDTITIADNDAATPGPSVRTGVATGVDENWTTITLNRSYASMVVVATPNYDSSSVPLVTRIQNAAADSFQLRVQRADGLSGAVGPVDVHYVVVEEGVYTDVQHGITMEAVKYVSTRTDRKRSWVGQSRGYANSYTNPVVVGQVMTSNDAGFSTFWSRGDTFKDPPSPTSLWVGKHVAGDPNVVRGDETVGYLVVEAGGGIVDGLEYTAAVGANAVSGITGPAPYTYSINGPASPVAAVASQTAMDGSDGGWAVLYGPNPVAGAELHLAIDEDQLEDAERGHLAEQVAYLVFGDVAAQQAARSIEVEQRSGLKTPFALARVAARSLASIATSGQYSAAVSAAGSDDADNSRLALANALICLRDQGRGSRNDAPTHSAQVALNVQQSTASVSFTPIDESLVADDILDVLAAARLKARW